MSPEHDVRALEKKVTDLSDALAHLSSGDDLRKLLQILKRPGWTTPAEFIFANTIVDAMLAHARALAVQKQELMKGAEAVTSAKAAA